MTENLVKNGKSVALLIDPDKVHDDSLGRLLEIASECRVDYILAGGSITFNSIDPLVEAIRRKCNIPVVLFPGNLLQLTVKTDYILLLSLISGRNPEFLVGNHVLAAPFLKDHRKKVVPTGYILVNCGSRTSVEYMSQTEAIPSDKTDIIVATALAGEMLGLKLIYLEGGSGAENHVPVNVIRSVKENISVPLVTGGGIRNKEEAKALFESGADMIVVGNGCEKRPGLLAEICSVRDSFRKR